jgi:hypothetical protein
MFRRNHTLNEMGPKKDTVQQDLHTFTILSRRLRCEYKKSIAKIRGGGTM